MTFQFFSGWRSAPAHGSLGHGTMENLCQQFVRDFTHWVKAFPSSASGADEIPVELGRLEQSWSTMLHKIESWPPRSLSEARTKLEAAQVYAAWASLGDGRASALIAQASLTLQKYSAQRPNAARLPLQSDVRRDHPQQCAAQLSSSTSR